MRSKRHKSPTYEPDTSYYFRLGEDGPSLEVKMITSLPVYNDQWQTIEIIESDGKVECYLPYHIAEMMDRAKVTAGRNLATKYEPWSLEKMFYLFERWKHLDPLNARLCDDQFSPVVEGLQSRLSGLRLAGSHDECRIVELLMLTGKHIMIDIKGIRHHGKIVAWLDDPDKKSFSIDVEFESCSPQGLIWRLQMTERNGKTWAARTDSGMTFTYALSWG